MACSSSNPHVTLEIEEEYPYPSNFSATSFISVKLSGKDKYNIWKTQILCLLESHGMLGFIDGTLVSPQTSDSGKEKVGDHQTRHRLWRRSDALVKGWILGALSEKTVTDVVDRLTERHERNAGDFNAKHIWDELHTMYAPAVLPQLIVADKQEKEIARDKVHQELHKAILRGDIHRVVDILRYNKVTVVDKINTNGNTALHLAVSGNMQKDSLRELMRAIPESTQILDVRNSEGSTPLHLAAIIGNIKAAEVFVNHYPDWLLAKDNEGQTPLALAFSNMHNETARLLLQHVNTGVRKDTLFSGTSGDELLVTVISSKDFSLANDLLGRYSALHSDAVLMAIAQNFPSKGEKLYYYLGSEILNYGINFANCISLMESCLPRWLFLVLTTLIILLFGGFYIIFWLLMLILKKLVKRFSKEFQIYEDAMRLLDRACHRLRESNKHAGSYHRYYTNPMFEATRQNIYQVVRIIVICFQDANFSTNQDGHNIIQYAVINRSEKVYNIIYQLNQHRNIYRTIKDSSGNTLLHLAARLAPSNKLSLISGAALQIQRELQWFQEVKGFVGPLTIIQKNSFNETPQMVFTREHKDLVIEGEKWMKTTAESYSITAALIITIVFAAAITVPGGSNQETGIPIFTDTPAFTIFAISDAISLFTAVTSLLMFLSILTARFAERDFLFKLPAKLIIGLTTLFISTTAMVVAFAATLYIVFGQSNSRILISIVVLTCLPITSFVTLQFPLVLELMSATYGRSIFGHRSLLAHV